MIKTAPKKANQSIADDIKRVISGRLRAIDIKAALGQSIREHNEEISDLNTEQLNKGQKADGSSTGDYANVGYKGRLRPVDLYDTGDFHESVFAEAFEDSFSMNATDPKTEMLQDKYGDEILGLTKPNIQVAGEIIKPTLIEKVRQQL